MADRHRDAAAIREALAERGVAVCLDEAERIARDWAVLVGFARILDERAAVKLP